MKIRDTGYATPYAPVAPAAPGEAAQRTSAAGAAPLNRRPADQATLLGIPESELTPKVRAALEELMAEVHRLRQELEQSRRRAEHLEQVADQDSLIPVLNRRAFVRELSRVVSFTERYGSGSAVVYFDVNGLKAINDSHGHAAGDAALAHVAQVLMAHVRSSDIIGRLGGDEFGVILVQAPPQEATSKAATLADAIAARPVPWQGLLLSVGASFGVHNLLPGQQAHEVLDAADRAMYEHKRTNS